MPTLNEETEEATGEDGADELLDDADSACTALEDGDDMLRVCMMECEANQASASDAFRWVWLDWFAILNQRRDDQGQTSSDGVG